MLYGILDNFLKLLLAIQSLFNTLVHFLDVRNETASEERVIFVGHHDFAVTMEQEIQLVAPVARLEDPLALLDVGPASRSNDLMHCVLV